MCGTSLRLHRNKSCLVVKQLRYWVCSTVMTTYFGSHYWPFSGRWHRINDEQYAIYRVILKSLRDFRPLPYSSRDGHAEGEHVNRGRDTPIFCPTLQMLDISTLGDAADVNPVIKFLPHTLHVCGRNLIKS